MRAPTAVIFLLLSSFAKTQTRRKVGKAVRNNNLKAVKGRLRARSSRAAAHLIDPVPNNVTGGHDTPQVTQQAAPKKSLQTLLALGYPRQRFNGLQAKTGACYYTGAKPRREENLRLSGLVAVFFINYSYTLNFNYNSLCTDESSLLLSSNHLSLQRNGTIRAPLPLWPLLFSPHQCTL